MSPVEFNEKFNPLNDRLFGFAMRLTKNKEDAKDLMQETIFKAFRNRDRFRPGTNFKAWVSTIMRNSFINNYRKKKTRNQIEQPVDDLQIAAGNKAINGNAYTSIMAKEILSMVDELSDLYAVPFMMHYQGYEYQEIAQNLSVPMGTIKSRIHTARKKLKDMINERYGRLEGYAISA